MAAKLVTRQLLDGIVMQMDSHGVDVESSVVRCQNEVAKQKTGARPVAEIHVATPLLCSATMSCSSEDD